MEKQNNKRTAGALLFTAFLAVLFLMAAAYGPMSAPQSASAQRIANSVTDHGTETREATQTNEPEETRTREATQTPHMDETHTPEATQTEHMDETQTPEATHTPHMDETETPEATHTPHMDETETPEATETHHAEESRTPEATRTHEPEETEPPEATETEHPEETHTPEATETHEPEETETGEPTHTPEATRTEMPSPIPTGHAPIITGGPAPVAGAPASIPGDGSRMFPETGKSVNGIFLTYWDANGGLTQQGYPISSVMQEQSQMDGKTYTVQYFERSVMEYHPENQAPYNVLLSQLGTFQYEAKYPNGASGQVADKSGAYFPQTGHYVGGAFLKYWQEHGGVTQQGYPISDQFTEVSPLNGKAYTVQYFERSVFELHPENQAPYNVLLSQLGTFQYKAKQGDK